MADREDPSISVEQQLQITEEQRALRAQFTAFLTERGLILEYDLGVEREEVTIRRFVVLYLAAHKQMLNLTREREPDHYDEHLASTRLKVLAYLWGNNRLRSPWVDIVEHEFPGRPLTEADIESFIAAAPEQLSRHFESKEKYDDIAVELTSFFVERGYDLLEADLAILASEVFPVWCERRLGSEVVIPGHLGKLLEIIRDQASRPDHSAWEEFVRHFFPRYS